MWDLSDVDSDPLERMEEVFLWAVPPLKWPPSSVVLQGQWIERDHCTITSACGVVILRPARGARCSVNGREVTASCRLTQGRSICSPACARMSDRPAVFLWTRPRELSEECSKDGTPSLCTQRAEDFLILSSSCKHRSSNSRAPEWRMTIWIWYPCLLALCPWENLLPYLSSVI